ncbi:LysR substrate-binding domain-containing protein [Sorangium sp. So ce341]|uniref:LysR substrate-binding domain-containing protein n=1 Tax=Sorangium sp. So ce341 TaxID=3133302 RepID=UPI003F61C56F
MPYYPTRSSPSCGSRTRPRAARPARDRRDRRRDRRLRVRSRRRRARPLGQDPFVLAAPAGHPLSKPKRLAGMDKLAAAKILLLDDGRCFRDQALALRQRVGADEASVRATSLSTLVQRVAGGDGVTRLPALAVPIENRSGALSLRRFAPRAPYRTLALAFRRGSPIESALQRLAATLRDTYKRTTAARPS